MSLIDIFENRLTLPSLDSHSFSAESINNTNHKIAKDSNNSPFILIAVNHEDSENLPNQSYYNLEITFNKKCIIESVSSSREDTFSVIGYTGNDKKIKKYFLQICEILVEDLGNRPTQKEFLSIVERFTQLFKTISNKSAKTTIQGLWAELFIICNSNNVDKLIEAWHSNPKEKFDFSVGGLIIEAKSCSVRSPRAHVFKQDQLQSFGNSKIFIASVIAEPMDGAGKNINDLIQIIEKSITDSNNLNKLHEVVVDTLGKEIDKIYANKFNYEYALESFRIYRAADIPQINNVPKNISEVSFKSYLDDVEPIQDAVDNLISNFA